MSVNESLIFEKMHVQLGCKGCDFCDPKAYANSPCCQRKGHITVAEDGRCLDREMPNLSRK